MSTTAPGTMAYSDEVTKALIEFRRDLHRHPELSLQEFETTRRIATFLQAHGVEPLNYPLKTGVLAAIHGKHPGGAIAVRADIDALPIEEQTGLPYRSTIPGCMHACGHDFHTASVMSALLQTKALAEGETSFAGTVVFVFQPAEEAGNGADSIVDCGVFEDYNVGAIIGAHNNPLLETGYIGVRSGALMASVDEFKIVIRGVGGHAAIPDRTVDPIVVGSNIVGGLQHIVSRTVSPLDSVVVTIGTFHAGTANNIIPSEAVLEGTIRCLGTHTRQAAEDRLRKFVTDSAEAYGAVAEIEFEHVLPGVVNDPHVTDLVREAAREVVGSDRVVEAEPSLGGEDFSLYGRKVPGCFFWVGTGRSDGTSYGWHHPQFDVDDAMIPVAGQVFTQAAQDYLRNLGR
ncbi:M20 metallopeptidase family protein [Alicyclobacillus ferrooxydans]|nr:M20 family metallopeptidase [Alicyclobacillus ferrooxydans]